MYWQRGVLVNRIIKDSKFEEIIEIQSGFGFGKSERFQDRIPSKNAMKQVFQLQLSPFWKRTYTVFLFLSVFSVLCSESKRVLPR